MSARAVLAIDQGTTGTTVLVVSSDGRVLGRAYAGFRQYFPRPGWVEHDAEEIWQVTARAARRAMSAAGVPVACVGVANQRETIVVWDPETLEPLHRAIVWQDRRTAGICGQLKEAGHEPFVRRRTGLLLDPYFTATKLRWILDSSADLAGRARSGELAAGTVDAWLLARLTGGAVHATDPTNASRTLLYDLDAGAWSDELTELFGVPRRILPEVRPSSGAFGVTDGSAIGTEAPVCALVGDQQAALYGQGCWEAGEGKCTYGTGAFLLFHTGGERPASEHGLLATAACDAHGGPAFALEGSILAAGAAIQWLRDGLGLLNDAADSEQAARSLESNGGVYMVPAFAGLGSPRWEPDARCTITGITRGTTAAHLARAALEAMAYGTRDVLRAMEQDSGICATRLKADGGAARNDWLMAFLAGVLQIPVARPALVESTALGAAGLAGLAGGVWAAPSEFRDAFSAGQSFRPSLEAGQRRALLRGWNAAVQGTLSVAKAGR